LRFGIRRPWNQSELVWLHCVAIQFTIPSAAVAGLPALRKQVSLAPMSVGFPWDTEGTLERTLMLGQIVSWAEKLREIQTFYCSMILIESKFQNFAEACA
jgi:hypothetical protein